MGAGACAVTHRPTHIMLMGYAALHPSYPARPPANRGSTPAPQQ